MENQFLDIKKIQLSKFNPRFTPIESLDTKITNLIIKNYDKYNEEEVIKKLSSKEGDFKDLYNLLHSIKMNGFVASGEKPILIEVEKNKYVIAEGNRRIWCLKMIKSNDLVKLLKINNSLIDDGDLNYDEETEGNRHDKALENLKKIKKILSEINYKAEWLEKNNFECLKLEKLEDDYLWSIIYTKHIVGERPGIRKWSRSKYFIDILNFFPNGFEKNDSLERKVLLKIKRNIETIRNDYKYAQFVRDIFKNNDEEGEEWKVGMLNSRVSALQQNFSVLRIKTAFNLMFYFDEKFDDYFKISFNKKLEIEYKGSFDVSKLFDFILDWFQKGVLTTRPIKNGSIKDFNNAVKILFSRNISNLDKPILKKEFYQMDLAPLNDDDLEKIEDNLPEGSKVEKQIVRKIRDLNAGAKNMRSISKKFIKDIKFSVFNELWKQYNHNYEVPHYNAMAIAIRSIYEQIIIWSTYYQPDLLRKAIFQNDDTDENVKTTWLKIISRNEESIKGSNGYEKYSKINEAFKKLIKHLLENKNQFKKSLLSIANISNEDSLALANFFSKNHSKIMNYINEYIHSSHRVYHQKTFLNYLEILIEMQAKIKFIIENINKDRISQISGLVDLAINDQDY